MAASESRQNEPSKQLGIDADKTNIVTLQNLSPPEAMRPTCPSCISGLHILTW